MYCRPRPGHVLTPHVSLRRPVNFATDVTGRRRLHLVVMLEPRSGTAEIDEARRSAGRSWSASEPFKTGSLGWSGHVTVGGWIRAGHLVGRLLLLLLMMMMIMLIMVRGMGVMRVEIGRSHQ